MTKNDRHGRNELLVEYIQYQAHLPHPDLRQDNFKQGSVDDEVGKIMRNGGNVEGTYKHFFSYKSGSSMRTSSATSVNAKSFGRLACICQSVILQGLLGCIFVLAVFPKEVIDHFPLLAYVTLEDNLDENSYYSAFYLAAVTISCSVPCALTAMLGTRSYCLLVSSVISMAIVFLHSAIFWMFTLFWIEHLLQMAFSSALLASQVIMTLCVTTALQVRKREDSLALHSAALVSRRPSNTDLVVV